ncbi:MAG: AAA family ATPase [Verrucomicrobia bacterium]|jgi:adenylate kinase|nr:AAA family ATPase [Verrucomicrobiota bacterium]MBT7068517.1 AAA family ATPase [Verrucomicrobiota bacterium]MBT7701923.1 AAA family ATPase [Verrucomicrobiota bacterium]
MGKPKCTSGSWPPCDLASQEEEISGSCDARPQGTGRSSVRCEAILLLGPTGAGKTPLGDLLAAQGLGGRRCVHFDFGAQLRRVAEEGGCGLTADDRAYLQKVLTEGALLEDETFYIARAILEAFMVENGVEAQDLVVLNGLPRHAGQARDVGEVLRVTRVVALECTAEVVHDRIATNSGGDRGNRIDDSVAQIAAKLELYAARTHPLLDHYRSEGVQLRLVPVAVETTPDAIVEMLNQSASETKAR